MDAEDQLNPAYYIVGSLPTHVPKHSKLPGRAQHVAWLSSSYIPTRYFSKDCVDSSKKLEGRRDGKISEPYEYQEKQ